MAGRQPPGERSGIETGPVVANGQPQAGVPTPEPQPDIPRARVLDRVREQLSRCCEEQGVLRARADVLEVEVQPEAALPAGTLADRAKGRLQPRLLEHERMQLEHGLA